jgi:uncharacterized protein (TIRG00374 family)
LIIAAVFLWLTLRRIDLVVLWGSLMAANPWWLLLGFLITNIGHVLRAHRWRYLLSIRHRGVPLAILWTAVMIGYGINVVLPRVGEVSRPLYLARISQVSGAEGLASVLVERFLDLLMLPILIGIAFLGIGQTLFVAFDAPMFHKHVLGLTLDLKALTVMIIVLCVSLSGALCVIIRYYGRHAGGRLRRRVPQSVSTFLDNTVNGLTGLRGSQAWLITVFDSIVIWACYGLSLYVLTHSIDLGGIQGHAAIQAVVLLTAGSIGLMFPTPGGLGSYGFAVSLALHTIYGVSELQANAYALLANICLVILPGVVACMGIILVQGSRGRVSLPLMSRN